MNLTNKKQHAYNIPTVAKSTVGISPPFIQGVNTPSWSNKIIGVFLCHPNMVGVMECFMHAVSLSTVGLIRSICHPIRLVPIRGRFKNLLTEMNHV